MQGPHRTITTVREERQVHGEEHLVSHGGHNQWWSGLESQDISSAAKAEVFVVSSGSSQRGRQQRIRRGHLAAVSSVIAGVALVSCVSSFWSSSSSRQSDASELSLNAALESFELAKHSQQLALRPAHQTTHFDVPVPKGVNLGQSFLVAVPGHRERKVQVPKGFKPGEDLSIKVGAVHKQQLQEVPEGEGTAGGAQGEEAAEAAVPPAGGAVVGFGGDTAGGLPSIGFDQATSTAAETDGGLAVDSVHQYFVKQHQIGKRWAPGDTQQIPVLHPLGTSTTGQWTSAAEIYGNQKALQMQIADAREYGDWIPGHPHGPTYRSTALDKQEQPHWNHFKLVDKNYERNEMSRPSWFARKTTGHRHTPAGAPGTLPADPFNGGQDPMHVAAYANPNFSGENPGLSQEDDGMEMVSPQMPQPESGGPTPQKVPGFIVATPDDAGPHDHKTAKAPTQEKPKTTNIVLQFPQKQIAQAPSRFVTIPNVGGSVSLPQPAGSFTVPQSVTITVTHHGPPKKKPVTYRELQKIPKLPPLKYFDREDERAKAGVFKHWDGRAMKVLNVIHSDSPGQAIDLNPTNWNGVVGPAVGNGTSVAVEPQGPPGFAGPMVQTKEGLHAASRVSGYGKGDRNGLRYRQFGDVAPAVGEPRGTHMPDPIEPTVIPSDPFGIRKTATPSQATEPLEVQVPAGVKPGQQFDAKVPGGEEVAVTVPTDAKQGQELEIKVPKADGR